jgi:hypothetical protein
MTFKLLRKNEDGMDVFILCTKPFQLRWFTDCGYWFIYVHFGKKYFRFSNAGYLSRKTKEETK